MEKLYYNPSENVYDASEKGILCSQKVFTTILGCSSITYATAKRPFHLCDKLFLLRIAGELSGWGLWLCSQRLGVRISLRASLTGGWTWRSRRVPSSSEIRAFCTILFILFYTVLIDLLKWIKYLATNLRRLVKPASGQGTLHATYKVFSLIHARSAPSSVAPSEGIIPIF